MKRIKLFAGNFILGILPMRAFHKINRRILLFMGFKIGRNVVVYSTSKVLGPIDLSIGDDSFVGHNTLFMGGASVVKVGNKCDVSSNVSIITGTHLIGTKERRAGEGLSKDVYIGDGCWIGYGVTILGGVNIGNGCIIAAGSLVNKDIPDNVIAAGVPAKVIKKID